ncbi:MAG TPA: hypothetical protein VMS31_17815, partial [Pyrinomonadaceae bacterium]|nr:hypothetical protein [Pyrinomonadaceae bacterium]
HFQARLKLINEMRGQGQFNEWSALVTNDFYARDENLNLIREAGCELLFSGLESFDNDWLRNFNKLQNTRAPQVEMISKSLNAGVVFAYGLMVDVSTRSIADLRRELNFITGTPEITLPSFVTLSIPLLGTPYFYECLKNRTILPETKLRDMDGTTILQHPVDPLHEVVKFVDDIQSMKGFQKRILKHALGFTRLYRRKLTRMQMIFATGAALLVCAQPLATSFTGFGWARKRPRPRTYVSTTEPLDHMYTPAFRVDSRFENYFTPTMVTDKQGELHDDILNSGLLKSSAVPARAVAKAV